MTSQNRLLPVLFSLAPVMSPGHTLDASLPRGDHHESIPDCRRHRSDWQSLAARAGDGARPPPALPQTGRPRSGTHLAAHLVRRAGQIDAALPCGPCLLLPWHHPQGCRLGRGISPGRSRLCAGLCRARPSPRLPPPAGGLQSGRQSGFPCPLSPHQGRDGAGPAGPGVAAARHPAPGHAARPSRTCAPFGTDHPGHLSAGKAPCCAGRCAAGVPSRPVRWRTPWRALPSRRAR